MANTFADLPPTAPPASHLIHATPLTQLLELPATARCDRRKLLSHSTDGTIGLWYAESRGADVGPLP